MMLLEPMLARLRAEEDLNAMLRVALRDVVALPGAEFGNIQMWDGSKALVVVAESEGPYRFSCSGARLPMEVDTCCARAARESRTVFVPDAGPAAQGGPFSDFACATFRSVVSLPLVSARGQRIGVVTAHFKNRYVPTALETEALEAYCRQLADAIAAKLPEGDVAQTAKSLHQRVLARVR